MAAIIPALDEEQAIGLVVADVRALVDDVVVVDNGSRPPGVEPIRHEFPEVHVVQSPVNRGFGGGSNLGIEQALAGGAGAILLLNNDATVDAAGVVAMLETLESDPTIGVVGPTLWHGDRCVSAGGRDIARHGRTHLRLPATPTKLLDVDYVPGTVALVTPSAGRVPSTMQRTVVLTGSGPAFTRRAKTRTKPLSSGSRFALIAAIPMLS